MIKNLFVRFGVWILRPVVSRLLDERALKENEESERNFKTWMRNWWRERAARARAIPFDISSHEKAVK